THTVAAAARGEVVQREPEPVGTEKPGERFAHAPHVVAVGGNLVRVAKREHERGRIDGLLVGASLLPAATVPTGVTDELQSIPVEAHVLEKLERLARDPQRGSLAGDLVGSK